MEKLIVIKVGGNALEELSASFYEQLADWHTQGKKIVIVHGGGNKISELSGQLQLTVKKKKGIRITDAATLEVTRMVLLGYSQPQLLQQLTAHQLPALGLNAAIDQLVTGTYLDQATFGFVGKVTKVNQACFDTLLARHIGVLAPLALDSAGTWLNINGDSAAAAIASLLGAEALYFVTDVPGIMQAGNVLTKLSYQQAMTLQQEKVITAGMMPKIAAAFQALQYGVASIQITNDLQKIGTVITKEGVMQDDYVSSNI